MIAEWRRCIDCGCRFGLIRLQCHSGLLAQRDRCGLCRPLRRRRTQAAWARNRRQSERRPESAPIHAAATPAAASEARGHV